MTISHCGVGFHAEGYINVESPLSRSNMALGILY